MMALSTRFDPLFRRYGGVIPVAYLRALSKKESNQNPLESKASYWGLLQVGRDVIGSFNKRHGTSYRLADVLDPQLNVQMGAETLNRIATAYARHPSRNLQTNFQNPEFVKLLTAGWNSGYSEAAGVGKVAGYLEARGIPVTHDNVFRYAAAAGGTRHLQNDAKRVWQAKVTALYFQQPDRPQALTLLTAGLGIFIVWGAYKLLK
jgi:hypothetical protein